MRFEIDKKEYELKLTFGNIYELNKKYEGGSNEVVMACMQGDLELFVDAIYFGLMHTKEGFTREKVMENIEKQFEEGKISQEFIEELLNEVVAESTFYQKTTKKLRKQMKKQYLAKNPEAAENPEMMEMVEEMFGKVEK
ncbi:tail assembly chaperone [Bacillus pacificus]|uniref:tail assembly chaperone n=1 Tax=Bacillus pacificus TaxID=2026187 RepID=UPI0027EDA992|nr:tail assembly chaperone [Bacillus pacificus]MDQ7234126.1 tail assembly chaperone [Bacillus pacificus]MDQ7242560.1 tail assembly chaperone [Bacillus pacificus]